MKKAFQFLFWAAAAGFLALQVAAWFHARAFLNYSDAPAVSGGPSSRWLMLIRGAGRVRPANDRSPSDYGVVFQTVALRSDDGVDLEGWFIPDDEARGTVAFFHGYGQSKAALLDEALCVHRLGYSVFLLDFRGSGGSAGSSTTLGWQEALDVAAAVSWCRSNAPAPLFLYGLSMGGAAVLRAVASDRVEPDGLILESVFGSLLQAVRNRFRLLGWPAFPAAESLMFWGSVQAGFNAFQHRPVEYARRVNIPVLALFAGEGGRVLRQETLEWYHNLAGPKTLVEFGERAEASCFATDSERWRNAVEEFLLVWTPRANTVSPAATETQGRL